MKITKITIYPFIYKIATYNLKRYLIKNTDFQLHVWGRNQFSRLTAGKRGVSWRSGPHTFTNILTSVPKMRAASRNDITYKARGGGFWRQEGKCEVQSPVFGGLWLFDCPPLCCDRDTVSLQINGLASPPQWKLRRLSHPAPGLRARVLFI